MMGDGILNFIVGIPTFCENVADFFAGKTGYRTVLVILFVIMAVMVCWGIHENEKEEKSTTTEKLIIMGLMLGVALIVSAILAKVITFVLMVLFLIAYNLGMLGICILVMSCIGFMSWLICVFTPL